MQLEFSRGANGIEMVFQDDGQVLVADGIQEAAVRRGTITAEEARTLDGKAAIGLIFRPGSRRRNRKRRTRAAASASTWCGRRCAAWVADLGVDRAGQVHRFKIQLPNDSVQQARSPDRPG
jgi:hypothetical protein